MNTPCFIGTPNPETTNVLSLMWRSGIHWLIISIETSYRTDHAGFYFEIVICNLKVEFNFYDTRHWNDAAGRYNLESEYEPSD